MTVLVAVSSEDGGTVPIRVGDELARATDDELAVLHVAESDAEAADETEAEAVATEATAGALSSSESVRCLGRVGEPAEEIVAAASDVDATYVVLGGRKRSPVGKAVFGSTLQSVLLRADCPVVTVPEEYSGADADGPVVAAIDRSDRAHLVVREAARLAEALSRPLHVVHVLAQAEFLDLGRTVVEETGQGVSMDDVRSVAADIASEAAEGEAPEATPVGLVGRPERRIVEYAREQDAGFVVASGRDQSPVGKVLFGSVTQSILLNADRPVVTTFRSS